MKEHVIAYSVTMNGLHVGNIRATKCAAEELLKDLNAKHPQDKREIVPLVELKGDNGKDT